MNAVTPWPLPPAYEPMRPYNAWFLYRLYDRDPVTGKYEKEPYDARTRRPWPRGGGKLAACCDWETVSRAGPELQAAAADGELYLPGFYFTESDPFFFFDLDECIETGPDGNRAWTALTAELLNRFPQAARATSSSGAGWHVIGCAK